MTTTQFPHNIPPSRFPRPCYMATAALRFRPAVRRPLSVLVARATVFNVSVAQAGEDAGSSTGLVVAGCTSSGPDLSNAIDSLLRVAETSAAPVVAYVPAHVASRLVDLSQTGSGGSLLPPADNAAGMAADALTNLPPKCFSTSLRDLVAAHDSVAHSLGTSVPPDLPGEGCDTAELVTASIHGHDAAPDSTDLAAPSAAQPPSLGLTLVVPPPADDGLMTTPASPPATATAEAVGSMTYASTPAELELLEAAEMGDVAAVKELLTTHGVDPTVRHHRHGGTALHLACGGVAGMNPSTAEPMIDLLVSHGTPLDAVSGIGATPLHFAAGSGCMPAVRALLSRGADPTKRTYTWRRQVFGRGSGQTPLHWAAESNHADVVDVLTGYNPLSASLSDERGATAGDVADKLGHKMVASQLAAVEQTQLVKVQVTVVGTTTQALEKA